MRHIILDEICKLIAIRRDSSEDLITIRCIGHSLGGALAMINAADLSRFLRRKWNNNVHIACCTFGSPAAGNRSFANYFNENVPDSTRVTVHDDPIIYLPCFPWFSVGYYHLAPYPFNYPSNTFILLPKIAKKSYVPIPTLSKFLYHHLSIPFVAFLIEWRRLFVLF